MLPMVSLAEEPFTLRNGYYWGMPKEEVLALADQEGLIESEHGEKVITFSYVPVGNFFVEMELILDFSSCLEFVIYNFPDMPKEQDVKYKAMFDSLIQSLSKVYGPADSQKEYESATWRLPDTQIMLFEYYLPSDNVDVNRWTLMYRSQESVQNDGF